MTVNIITTTGVAYVLEREDLSPLSFVCELGKLFPTVAKDLTLTGNGSPSHPLGVHISSDATNIITTGVDGGLYATGGGGGAVDSVNGQVGIVVLDYADVGAEPTLTAGLVTQYYRGDKTWATLDKTAVGLSNVENTALSTWAGSTNITTLGTITSGTWHGASITDTYISSAATWNAKQNALTGSISGTANQVGVTVNSNSVASNITISIPSSAQLNIAKLTNLTTNGFITTSGGDGTLGITTSIGDSYISSAATWNAKQNALTGSISGTANQVSVTANSNSVAVNTTISIPTNAQLSIAKITNLTTNGFVVTSGGDGTLGVSTASYLTNPMANDVYLNWLSAAAATIPILKLSSSDNTTINVPTAKDFRFLLNNSTPYGSFGGSSDVVKLGLNAGNSVGAGSTVIGTNSVVTATVVNNITAIGVNALGDASFAASHITAVGFEAGKAHTSGTYSTYVGAYAGTATTTGSRNTFIGYAAGFNNIIGGYNTFLGELSGIAATGSNNIAIGSYSGSPTVGTCDGDSNVSIGNFTLRNFTGTSGHNIAIGNHALGDDINIASSQSSNIAIGYYALSKLQVSTNVAVGNAAGIVLATGTSNTLLGNSTGLLLTTGISNTAVGLEAVSASAINASYTTAVGEKAAAYANGSYNTALGYKAGYNSNNGSSNLFLGPNAGPSSPTTESNKLYIANAAGTPLIKGDFSAKTIDIDGTITSGIWQGTAIGDSYISSAATWNAKQNALTGSVSGTANQISVTANSNSVASNITISIPSSAQLNIAKITNLTTNGFVTTSGSDGTLGVTVASYLTNPMTNDVYLNWLSSAAATIPVLKLSSTDNTTINAPTGKDFKLLVNNTTPYGSFGAASTAILLGKNAGTAAGAGSTIIGDSAVVTATANTSTVAIGTSALGSASLTKGSLVAIGFEAGKAHTTGDRVLYLGYQAGLAITTGSDNTFIGYQSCIGSATGSDNTYVGSKAGLRIGGSSNNNTYLGSKAGTGGLAGTVYPTNCVGVGAFCNDVITNNITDCVSIGYYSNRYGYGNYNTCIGSNTAPGNNFSGSYNCLLGYNTGRSLTTGGNNVFIGVDSTKAAGYANTEGSDNVFIGARAGAAVTTVSSLTMIGARAGVVHTSGTYATYVGYQAGLAVTTGGSNTLIGYDTGKALTTTSSNTFVGTSAGNTSTGSSNTALGYQAGSNSTSGSSNVYLGNQAGPSSAATVESNKLYIANAAGTPLIKGDFSAKTVVIDGTLDTTNMGIQLLGKLVSANFNSTADQAITIRSANYHILYVAITNTSIDPDTAVGGIYTGAAKTGDIIVDASKSYSGCTPSTAWWGIGGSLIDFSLSASTARLTSTTIYLSLTTPQGSACTADIYIYGIKLD